MGILSATDDERQAAERAWQRLRPLALYPEPLNVRRVRIVHVPWLFGLPWFRRFDGYTVWSVILLRKPLSQVDDDLIAHEAVHAWQSQRFRWPRLWLSYVRPRTFWGDHSGYWQNPYEVEARGAVQRTRPD
jgi:hypothetical protein